MSSLLDDLRSSRRSFRRDALSSGVALLCIALGVGATTTVFSVADPAVALRSQ